MTDARAPVPDGRGGVRLLGRLLGDVIREQEGQGVFDLIEDIRRRSVGAHRQGESDPALDATLQALTLEQARLLIRGFAIFSQLASGSPRSGASLIEPGLRRVGIALSI